MKTTVLLALIAIAVVFGSCCSGIQCECIAPAITLQYEDQGNCPGGFHNFVSIQAFENDGTLITDELPHSSYDCNVVVPYEANRYWVITAPDFNISDTLRVSNAIFINTNYKCCDCGDKLSNADLQINQSSYSGIIVTRLY